ncbi:MAG: glycoside hydrolase family 44 protein [Acidimicrobiales bacterium]
MEQDRRFGPGIRAPRRRRGRRAVAAALGLAACVVPGVPPPPPASTTTTGGPVTPGDPGPSDVAFTISSASGVHPISPRIYGTNGVPPAGVRPGLVRLGGNRWTAYNWENNASNAGSDWCYQNDGYLSSSSSPGAAVTPTLTQAASLGATALVTVPIVDHVAADKDGGCDVRSTPNYLSVRFKQNKATKPTAPSATPDPADGYVYEDEYAAWLRANRGGADVVFSLDNEPDLWSSTHPEVHPTPVGYAELASRTIDYAKAVKRGWPGATVTGPVSYGFNGFESLQNAPDAGGKGSFLDWYLDQMKAADVANGGRLLDQLDLHWYPEARGGGVRITGPEATPAVAAARVQAPRSLWDPAYVEDSWITTDYGYGPIRLLPRTRDRISTHYPGTGIAVTEWNYGGGTDISGAVASADVLGVFGREGVSMAAMWPLNGDERFTYAAFRAFRNYDGAGHGFGDTAVDAQTSDAATASVYASYDAADPNRVVLVAVNKSTSAKTAGIRLGLPQQYGRADVWTVTAGGGPQPVAAPGVTAVASNAFSYAMPPMSVSVLVPRA